MIDYSHRSINSLLHLNAPPNCSVQERRNHQLSDAQGEIMLDELCHQGEEWIMAQGKHIKLKIREMLPFPMLVGVPVYTYDVKINPILPITASSIYKTLTTSHPAKGQENQIEEDVYQLEMQKQVEEG
ncbi:hypothetical protein RYX36_033518 [Vicia faba]